MHDATQTNVPRLLPAMLRNLLAWPSVVECKKCCANDLLPDRRHTSHTHAHAHAHSQTYKHTHTNLHTTHTHTHAHAHAHTHHTHTQTYTHTHSHIFFFFLFFLLLLFFYITFLSEVSDLNRSYTAILILLTFVLNMAVVFFSRVNNLISYLLLSG